MSHIVRFLKDLWWWWRARRMLQVPDGVRMGTGSTGQTYETIVPRWWDLRRWWQWLHADGTAEVHLLARDGKPAMMLLRIRNVEPPTQVPVYRGKRMIDVRRTWEELKAERDPRYRTVSDDELERRGITFHDDSEGW